MDIWHKLSIKQKFLTVFIIQDISLLLALIFLGANFGLLIFISLLVFWFFYNSDNLTKKYFFIFSIVMMCSWLLENSMSLRSDINVDYNQLKSYSGNTAHDSHGRGPGLHHHFMKLEKNRNGNYRDGGHRNFICGIKYFSSCSEELRDYFGKGNIYDKNISVKYAEFPDINTIVFIIPFFTDENIIYEIKHNDKIIYDYDYFISKYSQEQKNAKIYAIYLILNTLIFCVFYHRIQKRPFRQPEKGLNK